MNDSRTAFLDWVEQGRIAPEALPAAMRLAGIMPAQSAWRAFLDQLALWLGVIFCAAAVIFFFAYNWQAMGRYAKFGLAEILIVASLVMVWRCDLTRLAGQAALLGAALLVGALLALVGQTYQTGADTYELFAVWALAILPWVALSRFGALWMFWLGLLNVAAILYHRTFGGWFGFMFDTEQLMWVLFALNTLAWGIWESAAQYGVSWLQARWPIRILSVASGGLITALAMWTVLDHRHERMLTLLVYIAWMGAAYALYRHRTRDVFVLAGGVLSAIILVAASLSRLLLQHDSGGGFLLIGLVIIGMSAAGGMWLKAVAQEMRT